MNPRHHICTGNSLSGWTDAGSLFETRGTCVLIRATHNVKTSGCSEMPGINVCFFLIMNKKVNAAFKYTGYSVDLPCSLISHMH